MSTPANDGMTNEPKPKTITKFKRRISRILGKDNAKRATQADPAQKSATGPSASEGATTLAPAVPTGPPTESKTDDKATQPSEVATPAVATSAVIPSRPKPGLSAEEYAKAQEEKVRALFAKYNVTLEVGEWTPPFKADLPRIEKKIRMRVHRTCHHCHTQYGADRVCRSCAHKCCKKCSRYPLKKGEQQARPKDATAAAAKSDSQPGKKPVTQRSRMICHECKTAFKSRSKQCANCQHERCSQCRRSLSKGDTLVGGAIGPAPPDSFIKWTCHECDNVHREPENPCLKCGHDKCDLCKKEKVSRGTSKPTESSTVKVAEDNSKTADSSTQALAG